MIAYNKIWLANLRLRNEIKKAFVKGNITDSEVLGVKEKYPVGFYTPNLVVRVGLFILTVIIILFSAALLLLITNGLGNSGGYGWLFFLGTLNYLALELIVKNKHHYRSGVDDALLFIAGCQFIGGVFLILSKNNSGPYYFYLSAAVFILCFYFSSRFADVLASAVCSISFFSFIFFGWTRIVPAGLTTIPFIMMLISAGTYWLSYTYGNQAKLINYKNCLITAQIICLLTLYSAGNYYIVQTLSHEMNEQTDVIAFGGFFWAWTTMLPIGMVWLGIKKKDSLLLRTGLFLIAAAVATFRYYHHILPMDVALTLVGALLLGIVYGVMKYLKTPKHGFTYSEPDEVNLMDNLKVESLIVAETFSHTPTAPADEGVKFGGGGFGGGGSSGGF